MFEYETASNSSIPDISAQRSFVANSTGSAKFRNQTDLERAYEFLCSRSDLSMERFSNVRGAKRAGGIAGKHGGQDPNGEPASGAAGWI